MFTSHQWAKTCHSPSFPSLRTLPALDVLARLSATVSGQSSISSLSFPTDCVSQLPNKTLVTLLTLGLVRSLAQVSPQSSYARQGTMPGADAHGQVFLLHFGLAVCMSVASRASGNESGASSSSGVSGNCLSGAAF